MFKFFTMTLIESFISKYPLKFSIYTKSMELFELYSKEKANFFLKLFIIKIRCVVNVDDICGLLRNR